MDKAQHLLGDNPLIVIPRIAKIFVKHCPTINPTEGAMFLQQLHYWAEKQIGKVIDGQRWIWNSIKDWMETNFSWLSYWQVRKTFKALRDIGLVKFEKFDKSQFNHRGYYRIDYQRLEVLQLSICEPTQIDLRTAHKSKTEITYPENNSNKISPPTSSNQASFPQEERENLKNFLGIRANRLTLATFTAMLKPIREAIDSLKGQPSAPPPRPVEKPIPAKYQTDEQASIATASVLRKLSEITGESVEHLRVNVGLQKALKEHPEALEGVLEHLQSDCKSFRPGVGYIVNALRSGVKRQKPGGQSFKQWFDEGKQRRLIEYTMGEGDDIFVQFKSGKSGLYSHLQSLSWEEIQASYG